MGAAGGVQSDPAQLMLLTDLSEHAGQPGLRSSPARRSDPTCCARPAGRARAGPVGGGGRCPQTAASPLTPMVSCRSRVVRQKSLFRQVRRR